MKCLCRLVSFWKRDTVSSQRLPGEISDLRPVLFKDTERQREYSGLSEVFNKLLRRKTRFPLKGLQGIESISYDLPEGAEVSQGRV